MNLQRLNHVLLPSTKTGRDRYRTGLLGKIARPLIWLFQALSNEGRFLLLLWLVAGAFGLDVRKHRVHQMWCLLSGLLLQALLLRRFAVLEGVKLVLSYPERVTVAERMTISILLQNTGDKSHHDIHVDGPLLPWDGQYLTAERRLPQVGAQSQASLDVGLRFIERGEHHLDRFHVAQRAALGLGLGPSLPSEGMRFLVLPKVCPISALSTELGARYQPGGVALASKTGESTELVGLRPYRPGDPVRDLCAKAWARTGQPVVREYQQEYFTRFGVVMDTDIAIASPERFEAAISLTAGVLEHLSRAEALVDLLVFGDEVHRLTLGRSLGFVEQGLDLLACARAGENLKIEALMAQLDPHLSQLSAVVFVALEWDAPRRALLAQIQERGVGVSALVVRDEAVPDPKAKAVPVEQIRSGRALML